MRPFYWPHIVLRFFISFHFTLSGKCPDNKYPILQSNIPQFNSGSNIIQTILNYGPPPKEPILYNYQQSNNNQRITESISIT